MKRVIKFNITDYIDADTLNGMVDDVMAGRKGVPEDIDFYFKKITPDGTVTMQSEFSLSKE